MNESAHGLHPKAFLIYCLKDVVHKICFGKAENTAEHLHKDLT